jgi:tRNA uridine 5-carboxymethylaminomethyl modification enzyme
MIREHNNFDIIVIGAGHAGTEAALTAARMGCSTLLATMNLDTLGYMSCNPAIGGIGKGHLVREIDALGGEMAKATDASGIQFRRLNMSRGPAARALRVQADRSLYRAYMSKVLENQENLRLRQAIITEVLVSNGRACGVKEIAGEIFTAKAVIITPGTFLNGLIHIGLTHFPGGRLGDMASVDLPRNLQSLGFILGRFKTGTTPRIDGRTIDFTRMEAQPGDDPPMPFSFSSRSITTTQVPCYITHTNPETHEIIREGLDRSPLYSGIITGTGVRYCPSIEDKIMRFADRDSHHVFVEPEGVSTTEFYPNGLSTSLPLDIQIRMLRSIRGLEQAEILRPGYGIEHDYADPLQLYPTMETKLIENLYFAGQINGTTGYEEAAAQGLMAGINAVQKIKGEAPVIFTRAEAYIGVLIDDLVTRGTNEPYRMFSSRCEYRLLLREDNADLRLSGKGYQLGLVREDQYRKVQEKKIHVEEEIGRLKETRINPTAEVNATVAGWGTSSLRKTTSLEELLRRPEVDYHKLTFLSPMPGTLTDSEIEQVELDIKYRGFVERQEEDVKKFKSLEEITLDGAFSYKDVPGISCEAVEKLEKARPLSLGQASRISGITPAAIWTLMMHLKNRK